MVIPFGGSSDPGRSDLVTEYERHPEEPLGTAVVSAVSAASEVPPDRLPPLYDVVDPEALDRLFAGHTGASDDAGGTISFPYAGYRVTVTDERSVRVGSADRD